MVGAVKGQLMIKAEHRMQKMYVITMRAFFCAVNGKERTYLSSDIRELLDHSIMHQKAP